MEKKGNIDPPAPPEYPAFLFKDPPSFKNPSKGMPAIGKPLEQSLINVKNDNNLIKDKHKIIEQMDSICKPIRVSKKSKVEINCPGFAVVPNKHIPGSGSVDVKPSESQSKTIEELKIPGSSIMKGRIIGTVPRSIEFTKTPEYSEDSKEIPSLVQFVLSTQSNSTNKDLNLCTDSSDFNEHLGSSYREENSSDSDNCDENDFNMTVKMKKMKIKIEKLTKQRCEQRKKLQVLKGMHKYYSETITVNEKKINFKLRRWRKWKLKKKMYDAKTKEISKEVMKNEDTKLKEIISSGITNNLTCSVCCIPAITPTILNCSHIFCTNCVNDLWKRNFFHCAICRQPCTQKTILHSVDLMVKEILRNCDSMMYNERREVINDRRESALQRAGLTDNCRLFSYREEITDDLSGREVLLIEEIRAVDSEEDSDEESQDEEEDEDELFIEEILEEPPNGQVFEDQQPCCSKTISNRLDDEIPENSCKKAKLE